MDKGRNEQQSSEMRPGEPDRLEGGRPRARPWQRARAAMLKKEAPPLLKEKATSPREVGNRLGQRPDTWAQSPRPTARGAQTPVTLPKGPCCHRADTNPPPSPAHSASPRTSFLCRKDTLRRTAILVFSSPSLVPLLAAFMNWVI